MAGVATSNDRFSFRIGSQVKQSIERAAALRGQTLTDFAVATLSREADEILRAHQVLVLSNADRDAFLDALENPPKPNTKALRAAARFKAAKTSGHI
jgi:uncharacterized protein (DUF1778 family)